MGSNGRPVIQRRRVKIEGGLEEDRAVLDTGGCAPSGGGLLGELDLSGDKLLPSKDFGGDHSGDKT